MTYYSVALTHKVMKSMYFNWECSPIEQEVTELFSCKGRSFYHRV